jgi:hypothetical protein
MLHYKSLKKNVDVFPRSNILHFYSLLCHKTNIYIWFEYHCTHFIFGLRLTFRKSWNTLPIYIYYIFNICVVLNKISSYLIAHLIIYFISYTQVQSMYVPWPWGDCNEGSLSSVVYSNRRSTEVIWFSNSADCRIPHCISPVSPTAWVIASPTSPPYWSTSIILSTQYKTYKDYHKINLILHSWLLCYINPQF